MSQPLDVPLLFRAMMEERMEERMNVIMTQLERTNDRYDEIKSAAENRILELAMQVSGEGESGNLLKPILPNIESKQPVGDINLSEVYEENEDEVNVSFRVNEELVNASRFSGTQCCGSTFLREIGDSEKFKRERP